MSTSEPVGRFTFESLSIAEDALRDIRRALYRSDGDGFFVFRDFLAEDVVRHIRSIWPAIDPARTHKLFQSKEDFSALCSDFYTADAQGNRNFYNFFFNTPVDEVTWSASLAVQVLRNRLSGRPPLAETFPVSGRSTSYRVVITREAKTWIAPHRDYMQDPQSLDRNKYDLTRLQATLFLAEKGRDYSGTGFRLSRNDGRTLVFGTDVPIKAGDLVIWRYNNLHSVEDVSTTEGQLGFMRIIYPPEIMHAPRPYVDHIALAAAKAQQAGRAKAMVRQVARDMLNRLGLLETARRIVRGGSQP
jgi:hypothetical protein